MNKQKTKAGRITKNAPETKETLFIKHEFRNELIVVHEAISQVLDGLCGDGKDCSKCFNILKLALAHVDKISELIDELPNFSALKYAPKFPLTSGERVRVRGRFNK